MATAGAGPGAPVRAGVLDLRRLVVAAAERDLRAAVGGGGTLSRSFFLRSNPMPVRSIAPMGEVRRWSLLLATDCLTAHRCASKRRGSTNGARDLGPGGEAGHRVAPGREEDLAAAAGAARRVRDGLGAAVGGEGILAPHFIVQVHNSA